MVPSRTILVDPPGRLTRAGFTLVELLVVIAVLALGAALVVPAISRPAQRVDAGSALVEHVRALAVGRSQYLLLGVAADGRWLVTSEAAGTGDAVERGQLDVTAPQAPVSLRFTPFGGCTPVGAGPGVPGPDMFRCENEAAGAARP